ncbi:MAG: ABC transporter permease [Wenzhouxiangellaceae bacterium]
MRAWQVVLFKEIRETLRDRRAVMSSLVGGAIAGPLIFAVLLNVMIQRQADQAAETLSIAVDGGDHAPQLIDWLQRQGAEITEAPDNPRIAVGDGELPLVLIIDEDYAERWKAGSPAVVDLINDSSRRDQRVAVERARQLLAAWSAQVGNLRLRVHGIDPALGNALVVNSVDVSTPESRGSLVLAMWPYLVMISVLIGGMYVAIDATAGERERGSMEPLLLNAVSAGEVMAGKVLATMSFALIALALTLVMFRLGMQLLPVSDLGFRLNMDAAILLRVFVMMLPVALLIAGLQTLVAAFSKGFREAQTYLSFLMFIPALPTLWLAVSPVKPALWMMSVPVLSQSMMMQTLSRGDQVVLSWQVIAWVVTLAAGLGVAWLTRHYYRQPAIIGSN